MLSSFGMLSSTRGIQRALPTGRPAAGGGVSASLATRWMAPPSRRDDLASFYRCVMRRQSRGHFCRITLPFDRRFAIVRPQLSGRHHCSHRVGVSWRVSSRARTPVFESCLSLGNEEVTGPRSSSSSVIEQERWSADDAASSAAEKSFAWRQRDRGRGRCMARRRHPARRCAAVGRRECVALRVVVFWRWAGLHPGTEP